MPIENEDLDIALKRLREKFAAHLAIGEDLFFGLRRRVVRYERQQWVVVEWNNALSGARDRLMHVTPYREHAVLSILLTELAKLRAAVPPRPYTVQAMWPRPPRP